MHAGQKKLSELRDVLLKLSNDYCPLQYDRIELIDFLQIQELKVDE